MNNPVSRPISVTLPAYGIAFAESVHGPRFRMAERIDKFHKIIYVLQGDVAFSETTQSQPLHATAGSALCVNAGVRHQLTDSEPPTLLLICFTWEFLKRDRELEQLWSLLTGSSPASIRPSGSWGSRFEALWRAGIVERQVANRDAKSPYVPLPKTSSSPLRACPSIRLRMPLTIASLT